MPWVWTGYNIWCEKCRKKLRKMNFGSLREAEQYATARAKWLSRPHMVQLYIGTEPSRKVQDGWRWACSECVEEARKPKPLPSWDELTGDEQREAWKEAVKNLPVPAALTCLPNTPLYKAFTHSDATPEQAELKLDLCRRISEAIDDEIRSMLQPSLPIMPYPDKRKQGWPWWGP